MECNRILEIRGDKMKYYVKQKFNDSFDGFYLPEVHETMFNTVPYYRKENVEKQIKEYDNELGVEIPKIVIEEIEVLDYIEYKPKFEPFIIISEEEHTRLLNEVNTKGGELRFNAEGELVIYHKTPTTKVYVKPEYDYSNNTTIETASQEELHETYINLVNNLKSEVLIYGCEYTHTDGQTYRQKLRPHKDLPLVASSISFLEKYPNAKITWSFDDDHTGIEMALEDLNKLEDTGVVYTNAVYDVERDLKSSEVNLDLTIEDYIKLVKEKLNSFTFSLRGVLHE